MGVESWDGFGLRLHREPVLQGPNRHFAAPLGGPGTCQWKMQRKMTKVQAATESPIGPHGT